MRDCRFDLDGIVLEALRYGEGRSLKVLALHGWLDNAASFGLLAPLLNECDVVVLDLAGHGKSGFRTGRASYNIWQDLIEVRQVAEQLNWERFALLGHSRGAMISSLYAGTFPEQVLGLCLIDAVTPVAISESDLPKQLAQSIRHLRGINQKQSSYFSTYDEAALARMRGMFPLSETASRLLAERAVRENQHGFYWHYDKRLLVASEIRLSNAQCKAFVDAIECRVKVIAATDGFIHENDVAWHHEHPNLEFVELVGEHHLQLSRDPETITLLANTVNDYFSKI